MAQQKAERDVIINLKLIGDEAAAKAAANIVNKHVAGAQKQSAGEALRIAKDAEKAAMQSAKSQAKAVEKSEREKQKAVAKATREREKLEAAASNAAERAVRDAEKAFDKSEREKQKAAEKTFKARAQLLARMGREEDKRQRMEAAAVERTKLKYQQYNETRISAGKSAAMASKTALQGVLDVTEGLTILGVSSEESLEKFARVFVKVQAGFKALRGATDIFFEGREALIQLRRATLATAAANEILAASNTKVAVTGAAAAAAGGAAGVSGVGRAGDVAAGAAGGAGVGIIAKIFAPVKAVFGTIAGTLASLGVAGTAAAVAIGAVIGELFNFARTGETLTGTIYDTVKAYFAASDAAEMNAKKEELRQKKLEQSRIDEERIAKEAGFGADTLAKKRELFNAANEISGAGAPDRSFDVAEVQSARDALEKQRADAAVRRATQQTISFAAQEAALARLETAQANLLESDKRRIDVLRSVVDTAKQEVQAKQDALKTARDLVKTERERFDDAIAAFGKLSKAEQKQIEKIANSVAAGNPLNEIQTRFLEEKGVGKSKTSQFRLDQGNAAGGADILAKLGDRAGLDSARDTAAQRAAELAAEEGKLTVTTNQLSEAMNRARESLRQLTETTNAGLKARASREGIDITNNQELKVILQGEDLAAAAGRQVQSQLQEIFANQQVSIAEQIQQANINRSLQSGGIV